MNFDAKAADLERRAAQFEQEREQWEERQRSRETDLARQEEDLVLRAQLQIDRDEEFRKEKALFELSLTDLESRNMEIVGQAEDLDRERENIARERENLRREREEFESARQRLNAESKESARSAADAEKSECREESANADSPAEETADPGQGSVDLQEVLRRLGHNVDFAEDKSVEPQAIPAESHPAPDAMPPVAGMAETSAEKTAPAAEEEEESIDNYMAQLMQRLGVKAPPPDDEKPKTVEKTAPFNPFQREASSATPPLQEPRSETNRQRREPVDLSPRAVAPEKSVDLSALRDLANLSAEHALGRHDFKKLIVATRSKSIVTVVALAAAGGLFWHWYAHHAGNIVAYAAGLSLLAALYWGLQYAVLTGRLIINRAGGITLRRHHGERRTTVAKIEASGESGVKIRPDKNFSHGPQESSSEVRPSSSGDSLAASNCIEPKAENTECAKQGNSATDSSR